MNHAVPAGRPVEIAEAGRQARPQVARLLDHPTDPVIETISPMDTIVDRRAPENYFMYGPSALASIELAMLGVGKSTLMNILDLPCGHGRVLRTLRAAFPTAQLTACDIDLDGVDFCARTFGARGVPSSDHLGEVRLEGDYDLIWVGSLLTHLGAARWTEFLEFFSTPPRATGPVGGNDTWAVDRGPGAG